MENIIIRIRCDACGAELVQTRARIEPLTGVMTIAVGKCKPCLDEKHDEGFEDGQDSIDDDVN
jgi:hypothetical protein